ncbi:Sensor histidine kinase PrrB (RegB) [hydrothermal vent metagenome]|uniref:histidine kinase n=1 Tax=hydrothermal vent metagenome TaxID=652676 RepID=A0A3B1AB48_9ZZZZ
MFIQSASTSDASIAQNLKRLFMLRNVVILCYLTVVAFTSIKLQMHIPLLPLIIVISIYGAINIISWLKLRHRPAIAINVFFLQLLIDVITLALILYFTGGSTNPFVSLLLLPLVIVAATAPRLHAWGMAGITIGCYTLLMFIYTPLHNMSSHQSGSFGQHIAGMWFSFLLSVGLIVFFVVALAESLREREQTITDAREKALRDEHLVSLGTFAAGAAHELSTPLATMAVITRELQNDLADHPEMTNQTRMLREQIDRCKQTLTQISARAGQSRAEGGIQQTLDRYLNEVLQQWRLMRPSVILQPQWIGARPAPKIVVDDTLSQSLTSILNNAADASPQQIEIIGEWSNEQLQLEINDRGEGLNETVQASIGNAFFTTKKEGQGLGIFLAHAVIERLGGTLSINNRDGGGASVKILLPLKLLMVNA